MKIGSSVMTDSSALLVLLGQPSGQQMDENASHFLQSILYRLCKPCCHSDMAPSVTLTSELSI